jgi:MarR family transcriptional regulator, organic hydroperoxide resistance regulator
MARLPKAESPKLSNFLCFAIYSANLAFGRAYKPILDAVGLTYTQYIALVALCEEDDQTVGALGEKLFLESNTLTPILKKLESSGYIRRRRDPADERQVRLSLTPAGRRLLDKDIGASLLEATGLGDDFLPVQRTVAKLRDNLLRATQGEPGKQ